MEFETWQLTEFNLKGQINLDQKFGLIKLYRSDDGLLILAADSTYGLIDQDNPTPANFADPSSILGFVLDIGIKREKMLTRGHGFYFGMELDPIQSKKEISQASYDSALFEQLGNTVNSYFQSGDKSKETLAIKFQFALDAYNDARLMFPRFYSESYLSLMRILDTLSNNKPGDGRLEFALFVAKISPTLNQEIFNKLKAIEGYKDRLLMAFNLFDEVLLGAAKKACLAELTELAEADRMIFSCFYSAYQYRNKFVHVGFPFPVSVKDSWGLEEGSGTAYLSPGLGISWSKMNRPDGLQDGDSIDIHEVVGDDAEKFKTQYFQLLPTWHFIKVVTREAILKKVLELNAEL